MKAKEMDMLHGGLAGKLILFAIPLAFSSILQQLFNSADVAVVGRFDTNLRNAHECVYFFLGIYRRTDFHCLCNAHEKNGKTICQESRIKKKCRVINQ